MYIYNEKCYKKFLQKIAVNPELPLDEEDSKDDGNDDDKDVDDDDGDAVGRYCKQGLPLDEDDSNEEEDDDDKAGDDERMLWKILYLMTCLSDGDGSK
jgi:hypothetical protein